MQEAGRRLYKITKMENFSKHRSKWSPTQEI